MTKISVFAIFIWSIVFYGIYSQPQTDSQENEDNIKNPLKMVINEINSNSYQTFTDNQEFFELRAMKEKRQHQNFKGFSTQGYKVIVISTRDQNLPINTVSLEMYADLHNGRTNSNGYFVMGGSVVENVNFQIKEQNENGYFYYHKKLGKELQSFS